MHDFSLTERKESKQARARELRTATPPSRFTADYAWRHPGLNLGDVATRGIEPSVAIALRRHHTRGIEIVTSTRPSIPRGRQADTQVCLAPTSGSSQHFYTTQFGPYSNPDDGHAC